jgi:hypothetical protein
MAFWSQTISACLPYHVNFFCDGKEIHHPLPMLPIFTPRCNGLEAKRFADEPKELSMSPESSRRKFSEKPQQVLHHPRNCQEHDLLQPLCGGLVLAAPF